MPRAGFKPKTCVPLSARPQALEVFSSQEFMRFWVFKPPQMKLDISLYVVRVLAVATGSKLRLHTTGVFASRDNSSPLTGSSVFSCKRNVRLRMAAETRISFPRSDDAGRYLAPSHDLASRRWRISL